MIRSLLLSILLLSYSFCVIAFEPPRETIEEALKTGSTAFLARAVKTILVEEKKFESIAKVELEVLHCFYGENCNKNRIINMSYTVQTIKETSLPVQLPLGTDIIFILNHQIDEKTYFDSNWHGGIDNAFICNNYPISFLNSDEEARCNSIYGGNKNSWIKWNKLLEQSKKRKL